MRYVTMAALVGATITFLGGLFATLFGFRLIGRQPTADPRNEPRMAGVRRCFRLAGPLLMVFAVLPLFVELPAPPQEWRTVTTSDGVCRIEMPGEPSEREGPIVKDLGKPEVLQMLVPDKGETRYTLGYSPVTSANRDKPPEKLLEEIGKNWLIAARQVGEFQLLRERSLSESGWPGQEVAIDIGSQRLQQKWFVVKNRLYRALVETPRDDKHLEDARRFLESIRILRKPDADKGS